MKNNLEQSLTKGEKVTAKAEISKVIFVPSFIILFLGILGAIGSTTGEDALSSGDAVGAIIAVVFLSVVIALPGILKIKSNELAITNLKIFGKTGIIKTKELSSPIKQIQNVSVENGFLGKLFKCGTVCVTTTTGIFYFKHIKNANKFRNSVIDQINRSEEDKFDLQAQKIAKAMSSVIDKK